MRQSNLVGASWARSAGVPQLCLSTRRNPQARLGLLFYPLSISQAKEIEACSLRFAAFPTLVCESRPVPAQSWLPYCVPTQATSVRWLAGLRSELTGTVQLHRHGHLTHPLTHRTRIRAPGAAPGRTQRPRQIQLSLCNLALPSAIGCSLPEACRDG